MAYRVSYPSCYGMVEFAKHLRPSRRGELDITDINRMYLDCRDLNVTVIGRGFAWLDTGTHHP
jgi:glucose-1-phosphate thymidylyltransferase